MSVKVDKRYWIFNVYLTVSWLDCYFEP